MTASLPDHWLSSKAKFLGSSIARFDQPPIKHRRKGFFPPFFENPGRLRMEAERLQDGRHFPELGMLFAGKIRLRRLTASDEACTRPDR